MALEVSDEGVVAGSKISDVIVDLSRGVHNRLIAVRESCKMTSVLLAEE